MPKISMMGAGSVIFAKRLIGDILSFPELADSTISLMDVDEKRLDLITRLAQKMVKELKLPAKIESTLEREKSLEGADYVICMIQPNGLEPCRKEVRIPEKYGVKQAVGDTLGPGGVFRALRIVPHLLRIVKDMEKLCPQGWLLNYSNPMAINIWALNKVSPIKKIGLCHSVQGTARRLSEYIGKDPREISYWVAGINHMAWFLEFKYQGEDAYPLLREKMKDPQIYLQDPVRFKILKYFEYFVTESSEHFSEYVPYFRKRDELIEKFRLPTGMHLKMWEKAATTYLEDMGKLLKEEKIKIERTEEYASYIIHSLETGVPRRINGNVENRGLITNLPQGSCVEVPCLVDKTGIHPLYVGDLPSQCASFNRLNINVQELAVEAALKQDKKLALQAIMLDPLTSACLSLEEIERMVAQMWEEEKKYFIPLP